MKKIHNYNWIFFLEILSVFLLTLALRLILAYTNIDNPMFTLHGDFLSIFTPDAALYGYYAKLLLAGKPHLIDVHLLEYIIYYLVKLTPFTLDQILFYLPAVLSSLVVIPTILIAKLYMNSRTATIYTGLIVGIGYGYYSRTYLGYCDTDILNLFFPMLLLYTMLKIIREKNYTYTILIALSNIGYIFWYHSSLVLLLAMNGLFLLYLITTNFKNTFSYKVAILVLISLVKIAFIYKFFIFGLLFFTLKQIYISYKYYLLSFATLTILALFKIDIGQFIVNANRYIFKSQEFDISGFHFISPMQFVAEAESISFMNLTHLISGNIVIFIISIFGYLLLVVKHKEMLLALPLFVLGFLSVQAGVRFHIYAVDIMAIGYIYFAYYLVNKFKLSKAIAFLLLSIIFIPAAYENYKSINFWNTKDARPVFYPEQVQALQKLEKIKKKNDYAVAWWDYGWPLWYYADIKTMIDNGRHHSDNYTVATILMSNSQKFSHDAIEYFYDIFALKHQNAIVNALQKEKTTRSLFKTISNANFTVNKNIDKYIILPMQMTPFIYTIFTYANIDPQTGKRLSRQFFKHYKRTKETKQFVYFQGNVKLDKSKSLLVRGEERVAIKRYIQIAYIGNKKMKKETNISKDGLNLIKFLNQYYIMDDYLYNSTLVQLLLLNNYNKKYFEVFYEGQTISIYKVKNFI